ncbi:amidohydrolase family protein [Maribacter sp. Asnod1-A12]|uniref:amidohydrolase family protein n=1 Tax=Maribacter sp. Asnod1-A12 TaxID=3160576 RepID=UPI003865CDD7
MRKISISLFILTSLIFLECKDSGIIFKDGLIIENISIIDPEIGLQENQTIVIQNGKIIQVSPSNDFRLSEVNTIIDGTGKYLIPGLWDTHIHFSYIKELAPNMFDLFLANGITSVRDTGGDIDFVRKWKEKSLSDPKNSPRVMIAGPLLDGTPNVYDGSDPGHPPLSVGLQSQEDLINEVNELDSLGVDFLKAYEMLTSEQFKTIARLGKEKGLKVTGHVPLSMDVISASNAGLNSMEHLRNLELSCASNSDELLKQRRDLLLLGRDDKGAALRSSIHNKQRETAIKNYDKNKAKEVLSVLAKNDTWQIPTLALSTGFVKRHFNKAEWQESFNYIPKEIAKNWLESIDKINQMEITPFRQEYSDWLIAMTGNIHNTGIEIMAGTDTPIFFLTPGRSLHQELVMLVEAGLTPLEAIKTATVNPAKYFNLEKELGNIKKNHWADLIILDANPLEDINNTRSINAVIKQGNYFDKAALDEMMKQLKEK